ncbi:2-phospho-L-lactate guanylyltransferase, partial [Aeromicrobium phragmitis]
MAAYGGASAARHRELGAIAMPGAWPGVRDDVDTLDDLERVGELGVGPGVARLIAT